MRSGEYYSASRDYLVGMNRVDEADAPALGAVAKELEVPNGDVEALTYCLSVAQDLATAGDLRSGLERIARGLRDVVPYDTLGVLLLDPRGQELSFVHTEGYPPGVAEHWRFGLGQGIVGTVAVSGEPISAASGGTR